MVKKTAIFRRDHHIPYYSTVPSPGIKHEAARIPALSRNAELKDDLIAYFTANPAEQGASIRPEVHVDRFNITRAFSAAAIPIIKLDILRPTLEKHGHLSLTDSSHLRQYIPKSSRKNWQPLSSRLRMTMAR